MFKNQTVPEGTKELLQLKLSNVEDLVDDLRRQLEENNSINKDDWDKCDEVLEKIFLKMNDLRQEIYYI